MIIHNYCKDSSSLIFIPQYYSQFQNDFQKFLGVKSVTKLIRNASTHNKDEHLYNWLAN